MSNLLYKEYGSTFFEVYGFPHVIHITRKSEIHCCTDSVMVTGIFPSTKRKVIKNSNQAEQQKKGEKDEKKKQEGGREETENKNNSGKKARERKREEGGTKKKNTTNLSCLLNLPTILQRLGRLKIKININIYIYLSGFVKTWLNKFQVHFNYLTSQRNGKQLKVTD